MVDEDKPTSNAFKNMIHRGAIARLAQALQAAQPGFAIDDFVDAACNGLDALELKARVLHVVSVMERHLPTDSGERLRESLLIVRSAARFFERNADEGSFVGSAWPLVEFVGKVGIPEFDAGMAALHDMTALFSAEFAIRGFISHNPTKALDYLRLWAADSDHDVRRLVSEGTRPRLPWGIRLRVFDTDPNVPLTLLESLLDDDSEYVRRSVSNHLNDLTKDHPEIVVDWCQRQLQSAPTKTREWVVRRGLRTLVKQGHPRALTLVGCHADAVIAVANLEVSPKHVRIGETLHIHFHVVSQGPDPSNVVIDYRIGPDESIRRGGAKSFRLKIVTLNPQKAQLFTKIHRIRQVTTRKTDPGTYHLSILINGVSSAHTTFELLPENP